MNEHFNNTYELIEKYCLDLMDEKEKLYFEIEMEKNPALQNAVSEHQKLLTTFEHMHQIQFVHDTLNHIHQNSRSQTAILLNTLKICIFIFSFRKDMMLKLKSLQIQLMNVIEEVKYNILSIIINWRHDKV